MLISRLRILIILFLFINLSSCQIDESLTKIKESIVNIEFSHGKDVAEKEASDVKSDEKQGKIITDTQIEKESEKIQKLNKLEKETKSDFGDKNKMENVLTEQVNDLGVADNQRKEETENESKNKTEIEKKKSIFELLFGSDEETVEETKKFENNGLNEIYDNQGDLKDDKKVYLGEKGQKEELISDPEKTVSKIDEEVSQNIPNNEEEKISSESQNDLKADEVIWALGMPSLL